MLKFAVTCSVCLMVLFSYAHAIEPQIHRSTYSAHQRIAIPGTGFVVEIDRTTVDHDLVDPRLLNAIISWLAPHFETFGSSEHPKIAFVTAKMMVALRHKSDLSSTWDSPTDISGVVAIYIDESQTIYLPKQWTGSTPAELSILVHEMVHHLQNLARLKFACAEAREKFAYEAQQQWLALFGHNLFTDFEIDPFTLLVRTECPV